MRARVWGQRQFEFIAREYGRFYPRYLRGQKRDGLSDKQLQEIFDRGIELNVWEQPPKSIHAIAQVYNWCFSQQRFNFKSKMDYAHVLRLEMYRAGVMTMGDILYLESQNYGEAQT